MTYDWRALSARVDVILKAFSEARHRGLDAPLLTADDVECLEHEILSLRDSLCELAFCRGTIEGLQANAKAARDLLKYAVDEFTARRYEASFDAVVAALRHLRDEI